MYLYVRICVDINFGNAVLCAWCVCLCVWGGDVGGCACIGVCVGVGVSVGVSCA